jgi:AcrR family transcriptional regulator
VSTRDSTRTRLLDATDELVFSGGDTRVPVDRILEQAGVSPATLYRAYGSREDLVAAALERRHLAWMECWDAAVARAKDDRERLLAVFDALDEFERRPGSARWCAFLGTAAGYGDLPPALASAVQRDTDTLRQRLRELASPVAGRRSRELAERLLLLFSGHLAMRLRDGDARAARVRDLAGLVVDEAVAGATSGGARGR